jgi:hypothetical protein
VRRDSTIVAAELIWPIGSLCFPLGSGRAGDELREVRVSQSQAFGFGTVKTSCPLILKKPQHGFTTEPGVAQRTPGTSELPTPTLKGLHTSRLGLWNPFRVQVIYDR